MENVIKKIMVGFFIILYCGMAFGYIPAQVEAFKKNIQSSTQVTNCANCDFRGVQELVGVDAHGAHMPNVMFQPCSPSEENSENPFMICDPKLISDLTGVNFANVNFFSASLDFSILDKVDLTGADLSNASVRSASLKDAKVKGIIIENTSFCNTVMPDGVVCDKKLGTWTGQGVTIPCNCTDKD